MSQEVREGMGCLLIALAFGVVFATCAVFGRNSTSTNERLRACAEACGGHMHSFDDFGGDGCVCEAP